MTQNRIKKYSSDSDNKKFSLGFSEIAFYLRKINSKKTFFEHEIRRKLDVKNLIADFLRLL